MRLLETAKRLAFISILFIILFNFPFIAVFNTAQNLLGVPVMYLFVFVTWALFITILFFFFKKRNVKGDKE
ncbi:hypothetical protein [Marivirga sericea]|uniref:hypothetical protein n=1 Tax=Marivirga sericea TaxID=1028 RepID=UPI000A1CB65B|nr:hypothetical protein [Marivirga sericea]